MADEIDLGEGFGLMSLEDVKKGMMLERDYRKKTSDLSREKESFYAEAEELKDKAAAVDLINQYGLGETVIDMINNMSSGQSQGNPQTPQGYGGAMPDRSDPNYTSIMEKIAELERRDEARERMFWDTRVQQEIAQFRTAHPDIDDEKMAEVGQFMVDRNLPSLEDARVVWGYHSDMENARLDGEKRMKEQLGVREDGQKPTPILSGGTGELEPGEGILPAGNWKSARDAAIKDAKNQGLI